jgi:hypothetical protein
MTDDAVPDTVIGALEDGWRPPPDPDDWTRIYNVVTGEPCPNCGTALGVLLGPTAWVDDVARDIQTDHGVDFADEWADGYTHPIYLYCHHPTCPWQAVAEWVDARPVFEVWIQRDAPTWRERVEGDSR